MRRLTALTLAGVLLAAACTREGSPQASPGRTPKDNPRPVVFAASLERFDACPELLTELRTEAKKRVGPYGLPQAAGGRAVAMTSVDAAEGAARDSAAPQAGASKAFSATNVQEAGVDEPDMVKTDGEVLYTMRTDPNGGIAQRLVSIALDDAKPKLSDTLTLPQAAGYQLLLAGDRLLAIGQRGYDVRPLAEGREFAPFQQREGTVIAIVDVSDPANLRLSRQLELEGNYASARMVSGIARIVLNSSSSKLRFDPPAEPTAQAERAALERNKQLIDEAKLSEWLPQFKVTDDSGKVTSSGSIPSCDSTYHPKAFSGFGMVSVVTVDPAKPDPKNSASVLGSGDTVYASTDNLYVATQRWPEAQPIPLGGGPADTAVGAPRVITASPKTTLHRFDIIDPNRAIYAASGEVRGAVLNQWSLSEHEGYLRVATTEEKFGGEQPPSSASFINVLDADAPKLTNVSSINDIAPGERIYGVRFMGSVGYVVTFKQIDPLHVVDLSDPRKPRITGELEIPGYSAYLHPVGEGMLLGIGQDATLEGQPLGTVVSLFDVQDPSSPKRVAKVTLARANSPVEYDHHAFTWWQPTSLAIVPFDSYDAGPGTVSDKGGGITSAAAGYRVADGKIVEVGRASHSRHVDAEGYASIQRSIVVDDVIYTVSSAGVMASALGSLAERGWLALS
jgi:uncharacterized secreted protein with C-terminal beta-propeller domain